MRFGRRDHESERKRDVQPRDRYEGRGGRHSEDDDRDDFDRDPYRDEWDPMVTPYDREGPGRRGGRY